MVCKCGAELDKLARAVKSIARAIERPAKVGPSQPEGFVAYGMPMETRVDLSWKSPKPEDDVIGYEIYRDRQQVARLDFITPPAETKWAETEVLPNGEYSYHIVAEDREGRLSYPSPLEYVYIQV